MGDPLGIGPEITADVMERALEICCPVVFGHWPSLSGAFETAGIRADVHLCAPGELPTAFNGERVRVVHTGPGPVDGDPVTALGESCAHAQLSALSGAVDFVMAGRSSILVTAPVSKAQIAVVHPGFTGHTEYLAARASLRSDQVTMVFSSASLTVGLVATHVPMRDVCSSLTKEHYVRTIAHMVEIAGRLNPAGRPRIAVAAVNPHGGEGGLLGREEVDFLEPFCLESAKKVDGEVFGPIPADTVFRDAMSGRYDGVVAAYHDQAMIPLKLSGFGLTTNVTMGLPFVRTSPDHGVAYDIAGTGKADSSGMMTAIEIGVRIGTSSGA